MADEVPLAPAVEELIQAICGEKSVAPPDYVARRMLATLDEGESVKILSEIRGNPTTVRNFSALIVFMVKSSPCRSPVSRPRPPSPTLSNGSPTSCRSTSTSSFVFVASNPPGNDSTANKRRRTLDLSDEVVASLQEHFTGLPSTSEAMTSVQLSDGILDALEELEFSKAFLILNYIGRKKLEDVLSAEKIRSLKTAENMFSFEQQIWNEFGRDICKENERRKHLDWDSARTYIYECNVYADCSCTFKGPVLNKTTTLLHKVIGDENVLVVNFVEEESDSTNAKQASSYPAFNKVIEEGIFVGRKCYKFFVFKDGGRKKKSRTSSSVKCYFVNMEAFSSFFEKGPEIFKKRSIQEARLSMILSKTITLNVNLDDVYVQDIEDVPCLDEDGNIVLDEDGKPRIHTDGTGFISEDLALKCPQNCFMGLVLDNRNIQRFLDAVPREQELPELNQLGLPRDPPLLIQFRMFHEGRAIKGTVLVNKKVRPSMIKVYADEKLRGAPSVNKFEIVVTSNKPRSSRLSKNLIALLHYGGVPRKFFLDILGTAVVDAQTFLFKKGAALRAAISGDVDDEYTIARMILSGIPLDEPFLRHRLSMIAKDEFKYLKAGKLPVADSFYVMGTADPTHTLNPGEVCVILEHGQISGPVLVYRNPGIHPGDIHVVKATYVKALEDMVGNSKYAIFFPAKGPRSMADEIAGGDCDGDMYWVSRNAELLKYFRPRPTWTCNTSSPKIVNKKPSNLADDVLERELFRFYLSTRFSPSKAMGVAADSWLVFMDRILTLDDDCKDEKEVLMEKINKLIDKYYDALDAPKTGKKVEIPEDLKPDKYPHHMERGEFCTYKSSSILGQIYDKVDAFSKFDPIQVWRLPCFQGQIEQIPLACLLSWKSYYDDYRREMTAALNAGDESKNESAVAVYRKYKRILYGVGPGDNADELEKSQKPWDEIRIEAVAAYNAAYDHACQEADPQKCNFAWKVAGSALLKIFMKEQGEKPLQCAPSVIREIFL